MISREIDDKTRLPNRVNEGNAMTRRLCIASVAVFLLISAAVAGEEPIGRVVSDKDIGTTSAAHSLTRGHNRKVIYDANYGNWYVFWLHDDGDSAFDKEHEGVVYQVSHDGLTWSKPVVVEPFQNGGITAVDVVAVNKKFYLIGLTGYPEATGTTGHNCVRELDIKPDGTLAINPPRILHQKATEEKDVHFYGSILHDSKGYFWVAARVGDSTPDTHAEVIRTSQPNNIDGWGPKGATGKACNDQWTDPYVGRKLLQGTIASRLLELGPGGVGMVTYNKPGDDSNDLPGQLLFVKNPTRAHDCWESAKSIVLADKVNQYGRAKREKLDRLDDRRFAAIIDPHTRIIHVAYIGLDTDGADNANLRYFTLAPPYTLASKSAETTVINKPVDGVHFSIDSRTNPSTVYLFYVANENPNYQVRMIRSEGKGWSAPLNISDGKGPVRYPQPPETIVKDEVIVAYQFSEKVAEKKLLYHIRAAKIILNPGN